MISECMYITKHLLVYGVDTWLSVFAFNVFPNISVLGFRSITWLVENHMFTVH